MWVWRFSFSVQLNVQFLNVTFKMWCVFNLSLYLLYPENFGTLFFHSPKAVNVFSISPFCSCTGISVSMMSFSKTSNSCIFTRFHPWCHSLGWYWSSYPLWSLPPFLFLQLLWPWCLLVYCQSLYPRVRVCESLFFHCTIGENNINQGQSVPEIVRQKSWKKILLVPLKWFWFVF